MQELEQLAGSYTHLKPAMQAVLATVELRGATSADEKRLDAATRLHSSTKRVVNEPVELLLKPWRTRVFDENGRVQRTRYELGLWLTIRDALRAGRIFRPLGRRYGDPTGFLMPQPRWENERAELAVTFGRTLDPRERLQQLETQQRHALAALQTAVDAGDGVHLAGDRLELALPEALAEDPRVAPLRGAIERLTPPIDIPDLLAEVEAWTAFTDELTHAAGATPRIADLRQHLHAALLAWGLNLGPTRMAGCCPLSYREIAWATEWYLGDEREGPVGLAACSVPDFVAVKLGVDEPGHRSRGRLGGGAVGDVDAYGGKLLAQHRELGHHDCAVGVVDRSVVDLKVQATAATDLQANARVVRGAH